jgi:hypothetical protein
MGHCPVFRDHQRRNTRFRQDRFAPPSVYIHQKRTPISGSLHRFRLRNLLLQEQISFRYNVSTAISRRQSFRHRRLRFLDIALRGLSLWIPAEAQP